MSPYIFIFFVITLVKSEVTNNNTTCDHFQANFNLKDVIGEWHVVAILPEKMFPEKQIICYQMDISETDKAGLRWLINKTVGIQNKTQEEVKGLLVRQRYHTEDPFDVWSQSVAGVNGCFQQVIALDILKKGTHKALRHDAIMQLHLLEVKGSEPFLLQLLWGRMVAVVIYRKKEGVTQDELKPVVDLISKLRGPQRLPKICEKSPILHLLFL